MKLNVVATGIAFGALASFGLAGVALLGWWCPGYGDAFIAAVSSIYVGLYNPTPGGALIGAVFGFVDAFICGAIIAWVYNLIVCKAK